MPPEIFHEKEEEEKLFLQQIEDFKEFNFSRRDSILPSIQYLH